MNTANASSFRACSTSKLNMRRYRTIAFLTMLTLTGCKSHYAPPETPMPPNTILLSQMMRELSAQPGFTEALLKEIDGAKQDQGKKGPALMTPKLADELRKRILGKDWSGLDRFPGWTMREINPTVRVASRFAGKSESLEGMAAVHPGAHAQAMDANAARAYLDLGPYLLDRGHEAALYEPSTLPGFTTDGIVTELGAGVTRGDGPNELAPEHAESQRLADMLNRLAANQLDGARTFQVKTAPGDTPPSREHPLPPLTLVSTPQDLVAALLASGHTVDVTDSRYFANFGHLHDKGQDVMMPFWINTQIAVPGTGGLFMHPRPLLVPVSHAELEWHIRGPEINADVSFYFGIDGKAEWRTMDTLDQAWVLKRNAHTYTGAQAVEATRLASLLLVAIMHQHAKHPELAFGGYYTLGVCQDGVSAIEKKLTGAVTLFPNTADSSFFDDPRDAEMNAMIAAIPKDRAGTMPQPERIFGSLPTEDFNAITIPGLAADLNVTYAAWKAGKLERTHGWLYYTAIYAGGAAVFGVALALALRRRKR
jgi:hypothetical protein